MTHDNHETNLKFIRLQFTHRRFENCIFKEKDIFVVVSEHENEMKWLKYDTPLSKSDLWTVQSRVQSLATNGKYASHYHFNQNEVIESCPLFCPDDPFYFDESIQYETIGTTLIAYPQPSYGVKIALSGQHDRNVFA